MALRAILARFLDAPQIAAVRAPFMVYGRAAGGLLARGLAFSALFAAIPTVLFILGLVGWAANDPAARDRITATIVETFPPLAGLIGDAVRAITGGAALTSMIGIVGVVWTVSQFFGALEMAMARIYSNAPERSMLVRTARGFGAVGLLAVSVMACVVVGSVALAFDATSATRDRSVEVLATLLDSPVVLVGLASAIVLLLYRTLPPRTPSWWAAGIPALATGSVLVVLSRAFVLVVPWLVGVEALTGSLASAFVTLAWLSLTFQSLLLGAAWVRLRDESRPRTQAAGSALLERAAAPAEPGRRRQ
jgi:membrane protein